jgi:hypothetical protein
VSTVQIAAGARERAASSVPRMPIMSAAVSAGVSAEVVGQGSEAIGDHQRQCVEDSHRWELS